MAPALPWPQLTGNLSLGQKFCRNMRGTAQSSGSPFTVMSLKHPITSIYSRQKLPKKLQWRSKRREDFVPFERIAPRWARRIYLYGKHSKSIKRACTRTSFVWRRRAVCEMVAIRTMMSVEFAIGLAIASAIHLLQWPILSRLYDISMKSISYREACMVSLIGGQVKRGLL